MALGACALALALPSRAQPSSDPLTSLGDPLELARYVESIGDAAIVERLGAEETPLDERLGAIRAARWLEAPERALAGLALLAGGDDPDLAPAAARSGQTCARTITVDDLAARESDLDLLASAAAQWQRVADDESARADIRAAAAMTAQSLSR